MKRVDIKDQAVHTIDNVNGNKLNTSYKNTYILTCNGCWVYILPPIKRYLDAEQSES